MLLNNNLPRRQGFTGVEPIVGEIDDSFGGVYLLTKLLEVDKKVGRYFVGKCIGVQAGQFHIKFLRPYKSTCFRVARNTEHNQRCVDG